MGLRPQDIKKRTRLFIFLAIHSNVECGGRLNNPKVADYLTNH
jgi:hypothetical protein